MIEGVPRSIAILLLAAFVLPLLLPGLALAQGGEAGLPAYCRRTGAHHCGMTVAEQTDAAVHETSNPRWKIALQRCPFGSAAVTVPHGDALAFPGVRASLAEFFSHPRGVVQTQSRRRIARERSRHKRGPPPATFA